MKSWQKEVDLSFRGWAVALAIFGLASISWAVLLGSRARAGPSRCAPGLVERGPRCCAPGQNFDGANCTGLPDSCPPGFDAGRAARPGCLAHGQKIELVGGSVTLGPTDWDSVEVVSRHVVAVRSFRIDRREVILEDYEICLASGACTERPSALEKAIVEPGLPVTAISSEGAETYCRFVGGRLPSPAEWTFAAAGVEARRFPWGAHGLVCRRAAFGLSEGPCGEGARAPDLAGARPDGATPDGVLDLAGNVAEWARDPGGTTSLHGGSFRSAVASDLKSWSTRPPEPGDDVGFRCVYPKNR